MEEHGPDGVPAPAEPTDSAGRCLDVDAPHVPGPVDGEAPVRRRLGDERGLVDVDVTRSDARPASTAAPWSSMLAAHPSLPLMGSGPAVEAAVAVEKAGS